MPYTRKNQVYKKPDKTHVKYRYQLVVKRLYGEKAGAVYKRTFKSNSAMQAYIDRQNKRYDNPESIKNEEFLASYRDTVYVKKIQKDSIARDLKNWAKENVGAGKWSKAEIESYYNYIDKVGKAPGILDNPYLFDRYMKLLDRSFDIATIVAGPGLAASVVKGAVAGTKLATSKVARATTKKALMTGIKKGAKSLASASKWGRTKKVVGKAFEIDYKMFVAKEYTKWTNQALRNLKVKD